MSSTIDIDGRHIGPGRPVYVIAEMSANHGQDFDRAIRIVRAAKEAGADAIKLQTYTPDTLTIDCDEEYFQVQGTIWDGRSLYDLYREAYMPWDWQPKLKDAANGMGLDLFSTAYDDTAVDFLEAMEVPAYKIASFEAVDMPLLRTIAQTGKPVIMSTGMATLAEIDEAVRAIREAGGGQLALLKCTSAYPARPEEMNLRAIPHLAEAFNVPVGLSDHTRNVGVPVAAVALGACIIEKHLTLSRTVLGPDGAFSLEPNEFKSMVEAVRTAEKALGAVRYGVGGDEEASRVFRRSLFVVKDVKVGERFTTENVRSIRPGYGLHPRYLAQVIGQCASQDIACGTPLGWFHIQIARPHGSSNASR
jgi:pseudaminic acid synthase